LSDVGEQAKEEVLLHRMPELMKALKEWRTYRRLRQLVKEAVGQQKDISCTENQKK
jgi:hypothetical protein